MQFPQQFPFLVIPTGAGPGQQRITINYNQDGRIKVYDANGNLVDAIGGSEGQIILYNTDGTLAISIAADSGIDEHNGETFLAGVTTYSAGATVNMFDDFMAVTATDGSQISVEAGGSTASISFLPADNGTSWFAAGIDTTLDTSSGTRPAIDFFSPNAQSASSFANIRLIGGGAVVDTSGIVLESDAVEITGDFTAHNLQHGTVSVTMSAEAQHDVTVTFPHAFTSTPNVTGILRGLPSGSSALIVRSNAVSTTQVTFRVSDVGGVSRSLTINVDWIAMSD